MTEPVAIYMPLGDGRSDAFRLVMADALGGDAYRLHDPQPDGEEWAIPNATTVFAAEIQRPGMLIAVAPYTPPAPGPEPRSADANAGSRPSTKASVQKILLLCFCGLATSIVLPWCFSRAPLPLHPADPLRAGALATGLAALWWSSNTDEVTFSGGVLALLSFPVVLFACSFVVASLWW